MKFIFLLLCILPLFCYPQSGKGIVSLLEELDQLVKSDHEFAIRKENKLQGLKERLSLSRLSKDTLYQYYQGLSMEYETYNCDSAIIYSRQALATAREMNNRVYINESSIQLAHCEAKAGMFINTIQRLDRINRETLSAELRASLYATYLDAYIYWLEYQNGYEFEELLKLKEKYQDSLFTFLQPSTYEYAVRKGFRLIETNQLDSAEALLNAHFKKITSESKEKAGLASILSFLFKIKGDTAKEKEYLAISAISDIKAAIRENISLRTLSIILFDEGDVKRADQYIKKSLDDANFYNARLRNIQASRILPIIDKAYQKDSQRQQAWQRWLLIAVSILSVVLLVSIILILRQIRALRLAQKEVLFVNSKLQRLNQELKDAGEQQKLTNISLAEANHIKEKFIGQFLEICTAHIEKLEAFRQIVNRKIKAGQLGEIINMTSPSSQDAARELKTLYSSFDIAFLNIYPGFVDGINQLLKPDQQYETGDELALNQELRVFALIRLGITDSNKIATFLHYSLRTIYNYRSKVKSKALNPEANFEDKVRHIGSFSGEMPEQ